MQTACFEYDPVQLTTIGTALAVGLFFGLAMSWVKGEARRRREVRAVNAEKAAQLDEFIEAWTADQRSTALTVVAAAEPQPAPPAVAPAVPANDTAPAVADPAAVSPGEALKAKLRAKLGGATPASAPVNHGASGASAPANHGGNAPEAKLKPWEKSVAARIEAAKASGGKPVIRMPAGK